MQIVIAGALDDAQARELRELLSRAGFADGKSTAGWAARLVKQNAQAEPDPALEHWCERIRGALIGQPVFQIAAWPKRIIGPMISRYAAGDAYGLHVDEPILDGARADLAFTLFISEPDTYDGGELVIETSAGNEAHKHDAGCVVLYPATTLHRVAPVTRGARYAAVGWVRSYIREPGQRELLFDLETVRRRLFDAAGKTQDFDLLSKCHANLMRMWAED